MLGEVLRTDTKSAFAFAAVAAFAATTVYRGNGNFAQMEHGYGFAQICTNGARIQEHKWSTN
jgi:hypothetical protein